jgi:hypothetical protein
VAADGLPSVEPLVADPIVGEPPMQTTSSPAGLAVAVIDELGTPVA